MGGCSSRPGPSDGGRGQRTHAAAGSPSGDHALAGHGTKIARREAFSSGKQLEGKEEQHSAPKEGTVKTADELARLREACSSIMLFSTMLPEQQNAIYDSMFATACAAGENIITQGEIGDVLYVVESGQFEAYLRATGDKPVKHYAAGEFFGELALMYNCPRAATVKCVQPGRLWGLARVTYEEVMRSSVALKMDTRSQFLRSVELLSTLSEPERETIADMLTEQTYKNGEYLWKAGDAADCLLLIRQGTVEVIEEKPQSTWGQLSARLKEGAKLEAGDFFGTQALSNLRGEMPQRRVGGIARGQVAVYKLTRESALRLGDLPDLIQNNSRVKAMRNLEWFLSLQNGQRLSTVRDLPKKDFPGGHIIVDKGVITGQAMYIVVTGSVVAEGGTTEQTLTAGDYFGNDTLVESTTPAPASYKSKGGAVCVVVDRKLLRELAEFRDDHDAQASLGARAVPQLSELKHVATLGVGGFGRVKLVSHHRSGQKREHYALKCMYKGLVIAKRQTEHIMNERRLLGMCKHTFLPTLVATFQDPQQIYVLMDLILGGELFSVVARRGRLDENESAFYAANVTCALEYLHARNIAYRDLKPENLMLDEHGYLKVVDFGFAKVVENHTFTVCGTPEYLAPETIRRAGHTWTVDWWALGVLLYELITGQSPFHGGSQMDVLTRIVAGRVPSNSLLSPKAWSMVVELLEVDPMKRLGSRVRGRRGVREHAFFVANVDVEALEARRLPPPWKPTITSPTDLRNFDDYGSEKENGAAEWESYIKQHPQAFQAW